MSTPSTRASVRAGINHLVLNVRNVEASHRFCTDLLGFELCGELTHTMTMPPPADVPGRIVTRQPVSR